MAAAPDAATWGYYSFPEADAPFCFAAEQVCEADMAGSGDDWPMHLEFSPDGLSVLAQGSDRSTRVWGIPQTSFVHSSRPETPHGLGRAVRSVAGRDAIYPAAWHPSGTCFAVPSKQQPVALHSLCAVSPGEPGGVRAADDAQAKPVAVYVPFSDGDTLADVRCLAFLCGGSRLLGAGPGGVHVFDVSRPGRPIAHRPLVSRRRGRSGGVAPLAIAASPDGSGLYACGSQDCTVGLFDHRSGDLVATLAGHRGGVNHLAFSPDGRLLATGARKDDAVLVWDLRRPPPQAPHAGASPAASSGRDRPRACASAAADIGVLLRLGRPASTHQRTSFCFDSSSSLLLAGTTEAFTLAFELVSGREVLRLPSPDGLPAPLAQFHPRGIVLATASGARAEPGAGAWWNSENSDDASSDASGSDAATCPASVRLFRSAFRWAA
ncbi:hypothetical protein FNF31_06249 [Cafeteria roenbergensis]|uniref:Uncharacterized protein n=1 Tax=Cafeteria roenbergensis TaxID=33653 RepID=A0A5A8CQ99_CAFRO|nr:hypothetical protein FNF31_06249 [Cafeteria roenbergensis]